MKQIGLSAKLILLVFCSAGILTVPLVMLGYWQHQNALEQERARARAIIQGGPLLGIADASWNIDEPRLLAELRALTNVTGIVGLRFVEGETARELGDISASVGSEVFLLDSPVDNSPYAQLEVLRRGRINRCRYTNYCYLGHRCTGFDRFPCVYQCGFCSRVDYAPFASRF